jgi:hypothetical protein
MSRYLDAATVLLMEHYELEEAQYRAKVLLDRVSQISDQPNIDAVHLACTMADQEEPWWDSEDPKVRAINQLGLTTLLLPSIGTIVEDVEAALGRELEGEDVDEKAARLSSNIPRVLAELRGEKYVDPLQDLLDQLQNMQPPTDENTDFDEDVSGTVDETQDYDCDYDCCKDGADDVA